MLAFILNTFFIFIKLLLVAALNNSMIIFKLGLILFLISLVYVLLIYPKPLPNDPEHSTQVLPKFHNGKITSITDQIPSNTSNKEAIEEYIKKEILEYNKQNQLNLTEKARDIHIAQVKPKISLNPDTNYIPTVNLLEEIQTNNINLTETSENFVVGTLSVSDNTEILSPIQKHLVIGTLNSEKTNIEAFAYFTSYKGQNSGIAECTTTTFINDTKVSGENNNQYATAIIPPLEIKTDNFTLYPKGTDYANQPEIQEILEDIKQTSTRYKPIQYKEHGYTREDLDRIVELIPHYNQSNVKETTEQISDLNIEKSTSPIDDISYANNVDD